MIVRCDLFTLLVSEFLSFFAGFALCIVIILINKYFVWGDD